MGKKKKEEVKVTDMPNDAVEAAGVPAENVPEVPPEAVEEAPAEEKKPCRAVIGG